MDPLVADPGCQVIIYTPCREDFLTTETTLCPHYSSKNDLTKREIVYQVKTARISSNFKLMVAISTSLLYLRVSCKSARGIIQNQEPKFKNLYEKSVGVKERLERGVGNTYQSL